MTPLERQRVEALVLSLVAQLAEEVGFPVTHRLRLPYRVRALLEALEEREAREETQWTR